MQPSYYFSTLLLDGLKKKAHDVAWIIRDAKHVCKMCSKLVMLALVAAVVEIRVYDMSVYVSLKIQSKRLAGE